jgi:GNAT superfamily N-acetyltransferase
VTTNWADIMDGTWPAAGYERLGPLQLRRGQGGGSRVSAASRLGEVSGSEIDQAEGMMRGFGQTPLFCLRPGDEALDRDLADRGYDILDPVNIYAGIGPERIAIMERAKGPKTGLLLRRQDQPAGTGFVAQHDGVAMVHALEILADHRRQGLGRWAMRAAAFWALDNGAQTLSVICTKVNTGANGLYRALGMQCVGEYHYRIKA